MKPTDLDPEVWTVRPDEKPFSLVEFGLTLAVFVLLVLVIFVWYVLFWAAS